MMKVICITERELFHGQITVGKIYYIDSGSLWINGDGDAYCYVYPEDDQNSCIGNRMLLKHFRSI